MTGGAGRESERTSTAAAVAAAAVAAAVVDAPGIVMMLGAVDLGKTTTATALAEAARRAGWRTAIVDADTGQSDLGPPATIGLGFMQDPVRRMADVPLEGLWFAGDTSPQPVYSYVVEGTQALIARARRRGARVVVVDTTGWVEGAAAVSAKLRKIRRIAPRHIVAIQRADEVEPILARVSPGPVIHRLRPDPGVRGRSAGERRAVRARRFAEYFALTRPSGLDIRHLTPQRSVVYAGRRVPASRVLHEIPSAALRHLLVGLADGQGTMIAMGTIVDSDVRRLSVVAPGLAGAAITIVEWGALRVSPDGIEQGRLAALPENAR